MRRADLDDSIAVTMRLREYVRARRRDGLVFAVLTALVTPMLLVGAVLVIVLLGFGSRAGALLEGGPRVAFAVIAMLAAMIPVAMYSPVPRWGTADRRFASWALLPWVMVVALAWLAGYPARVASWYWLPSTALALVEFALLGRAFAPREDYYLGWFGGLANDPLSLRDDVDRLHVRLGFMVVLLVMLLGAWADLAGSGWMLRMPDDDALARAAALLVAIDRGPVAPPADPASARALRLLGQAGLIVRLRDGPAPSAAGHDLLDPGPGTSPA